MSKLIYRGPVSGGEGRRKSQRPQYVVLVLPGASLKMGGVIYGPGERVAVSKADAQYLGGRSGFKVAGKIRKARP